MAVLLLWTGQSPLTTDVDRNSAFDFNSSCAANFLRNQDSLLRVDPGQGSRGCAAGPCSRASHSITGISSTGHRATFFPTTLLRRAARPHTEKGALEGETDLDRGEIATRMSYRSEGPLRGGGIAYRSSPLGDASLQLDLNCRHHVADDLRIRPLVDERQAYFQIVCLRPL